MTKQSESFTEGLRDRPDLPKERAHPFQDALDEANLLVERHQDVASRDWGNFAKNYLDGKAVFCVKVSAPAFDGQEHCFTFLVVRNGHVCRVNSEGLGSVGAEQVEVVLPETCASLNEFLPVLVAVGDLVDGPEGIIPSGIWLVGCDKVPLGGGEFLYYSMLPGHPVVWKWIGLPSLIVEPAKREAHARGTSTIALNERDHGLIESNSDPLDNFNRFPCDIVWRIALEAADYVGRFRMTLRPDTMGAGLDIPPDERFELREFALSSFDIFV